MPEPTDTDVLAAPPVEARAQEAQDEAQDEALVEESLVEEVSIDGMCGVY